MFLNKDLFIQQLFTLIENADEELVLIVPYIKTSQDVYNSLLDASKRGVQILIVCKEDCIKREELIKLKRISNMSVLAHPNIHSKIYLNQDHIIIGSMNLYEYSEKFNREAGILFNRGGWDNSQEENCLHEIEQITSGSTKIFVSQKVENNGLCFEILKSKQEKLEDRAKVLTQFFTTKKFKVQETKAGVFPTCNNFYDNIDVAISHRVNVILKYPYEISNEILRKFKDIPEEYFFNFRTYPAYQHPGFNIYAKEGEQISNKIYVDKQYATQLENVTYNLCKEIDELYRKLIK